MSVTHEQRVIGEDAECYEQLSSELPDDSFDKRAAANVKASVFARGTIHESIAIYPSGGGCIIIRPDGTWVGDVAPFCS